MRILLILLEFMLRYFLIGNNKTIHTVLHELRAPSVGDGYIHAVAIHRRRHPLVPEASWPRRGVFSHTYAPPLRRRYNFISYPDKIAHCPSIPGHWH